MPTPDQPTRKKRPLTLKQRRFYEKLATAPSATEAAFQVYDVGNNRHLAQVIASENMSKPVIKQALEAVQQATTDAIIMTIVQRKRRLTSLAALAPEHPDPVRAIAELNRMERVYGDTQPQAPTPTVNVAVLLADPGIRAMLEALAERLAVVEKRGEG